MSHQFEMKALAGRPIDNCLLIDAHGHLGENPGFPVPDSSLEGLIAGMDRMGIDVFCPSAVPAIMGQAERGNNIIINAVRRYPKRIFGYMAVDIGYPRRIIPELERCLAAGLRAIKIWSHGARPGYDYDHLNYKSVYEFADAHNLPILAHTFSLKELVHLEKKIQEFTCVRFILAHAGSVSRELYARLAGEYENVYIETCLSASPRGLVEYFVNQKITEKILWGSDAIFMSASQQIGRILFAQISEEHKRMILGKNAERALRISLY